MRSLLEKDSINISKLLYINNMTFIIVCFFFKHINTYMYKKLKNVFENNNHIYHHYDFINRLFHRLRICDVKIVII